LRTAAAAVFADDGPLARTVDAYEPREGQRAMAAAVAEVIERGGTLIAEAGTGTGKTLAYLVPAILSGQRVIVSTGTKNLQEQIFFKDVPLLRDALGKPFSATLMKGRSNYLCLHRFEMFRDKQSFDSFDSFGSLESFDRSVENDRLRPGERPERRQRSERPERSERAERTVFLPIITQWLKKTETGDRAELRDLPEDLPLWKDIAADAETCLGAECPRYGDCFVTLMRQRAAESDVVIVNHHLLCADAQLRKSAYGEVIPACATLVIDEAHQLEDVATQYFGVAVSRYRVDDLVRDVESTVSLTPEMLEATSRVTDRARTFFSGVALARMDVAESKARYNSDTFVDYFQDGAMLAGALEGLEATLVLAADPKGQRRTGEAIQADDMIESLGRRARELREDLTFLIRASDTDFVYYVESRARGLFLRASPIDVSRLAKEAVFDRMRTTVLTSATLAVDGSFEYVKSRLGLREPMELRVESEFDYARQALLYLPRRVPPPKSPAFSAAAAREVIEILKRSRGRAFVLFTSYAVLRAVQQFVEMALPFPILVQGTAPRSTLIEQFRSTPNAVLLATSSFWQGVDVVGEALSCVIIDKLPFASPGDPVTAARIEAIKASGGDAFAAYQVPLAILALQQGLGRLIRHRSDRGVLAILDPRLRTMGYGRRFLNSLPPAPVTHDLGAVERFFG
jgi:ATP-dependent DNA helicase DinG